MREKIIQNPLRILVYVPFLYPAAYFALAVVELFHWKVD